MKLRQQAICDNRPALQKRNAELTQTSSTENNGSCQPEMSWTRKLPSDIHDFGLVMAHTVWDLMKIC